MNKGFLAMALAAAMLAGCGHKEAQSPRRVLIDKDWAFSRDSAEWASVDLPHDWSVAGPYAQSEAAFNDGGYLPTGKGYYVKKLVIPDYDPQKKYSLYFEGAYMNTQVSVNGTLAGGHPYGYSSFFVDATPYLVPGENVIAVTVDNSAQRNCRWYSGSGIYRHVWLEATERLHLDPWGVAVSTQGGYGGRPGMCSFAIDVINEGDAQEATVEIAVFDGAKQVAGLSEAMPVAAGEVSKACFMFVIDEPKLWSPSSPSLYTAQITLKADGRVVDQIELPFGMRTFEYSADGLTLNGEPIVLNGACLHHDNDVLGAASYDAAEIRKAQLMKEAGFNAVRTSHNVPAPAFLDACDSIGLIVIDEAFDGWAAAKTEHDYAELIDEWWDSDIAAMVLRDRNHPSVMAWSIGNEIIERKSPEAVARARQMAEKCRMLDPTRPVTSALAAWDSDWEIYDPLAAEHDIVGYNYMIHKAEGDHQRVPERVMWQTESYPRDAFANWRMANEHSYVIGDFVWTGLDYIGESGIGRHYYGGDAPGEHWERSLWPWHGAYCGDVDITGLRKPISRYRDMLWNRKDSLFVAVREPDGYYGKINETLWGTYPTVESWNWPGWEGKPVEVVAYSLHPSVTLSINGKEIGAKEVNEGTEYKAVFTVPYEPGVIEVTAGGSVASIATAGEPYTVRLTPDRACYGRDGQDVAFVVAEIVDKEGRVVPNADNEIVFTVDGPATILGSGSADMKDLEPYATPKAKAWRGRAVCALRLDGKGQATLTAVSPNLASAKAGLK